MGLIQEIEKNFSVKKLYEVFDVSKDANESVIKKAYRKLSLKHHPDKFQNCDTKIIEIQTTKFQLLAKVYKILSDKEKRKIYDEQGIVLDDESMDNADWMEYWRLLFPKITTQDIDQYLDKYIGSDEEINDLKRIYVMCKGDMNMIYEHMIGFEEDRIRGLIEDLIESKELDSYSKFVNESRSSIEKRKRRIEKERDECESTNQEDENGLAAAIAKNMARRQNGFDAMLANMEAKYGGQANKRQKTSKSKRK